RRTSRFSSIPLAARASPRAAGNYSDGLLGARAALALHLDPVVVRESLAHDPLQILQPPGGARALLRFETGPAQAHRLPPEQVHGPSPARVKQGSREVQSVGHGPLF